MAIQLAATYPCIFAMVGVHPNYLAAAPPVWLSQVRGAAPAPRVVGLGESGLDYYRTYTSPEQQRHGPRAHLELANDLGLPVVIHCRDAEADLLAALVASRCSSEWRAPLLFRRRGDYGSCDRSR